MLKIRDFKDSEYSVSSALIGMEKDWARWLMQKKFTSDYQTKYFINVYFSDQRLWEGVNWPEGHRFINPKALTVKLQMYRGEETFDISISHDKDWHSIDDIEFTVRAIWNKLDMDFDHHN